MKDERMPTGDESNEDVPLLCFSCSHNKKWGRRLFFVSFTHTFKLCIWRKNMAIVHYKKCLYSKFNRFEQFQTVYYDNTLITIAKKWREKNLVMIRNN
jgi:hypothetical protein